MNIGNNQAAIVRSSWSKMKIRGLEEVGISILHKLFLDEPQTIQLFYEILNEDEKLTRDSMKNNSKVAKHAKSLASALDILVEHIDAQQELNKQFRRIGAIHKFRKVDPEHFDRLGPVLLSVIQSSLHDDATDDVINAWSAVYAIIKEGIKRHL